MNHGAVHTLPTPKHSGGLTCVRHFQKSRAARFPSVIVLVTMCFAIPDIAQITAEESTESLTAKAKQGDASAQYELGNRWSNYTDLGLGKDPLDYAAARQWYQLAADQGLAKAQHSLGEMFLKGLGGPYDYRAAQHWEQLAADQGYGPSQDRLCWVYEGAHDYEAARHWCELAANQGFSVSQYSLGTFYRDGIAGAAQDYIQAYMWLSLARERSTGRSIESQLYYDWIRSSFEGQINPEWNALAAKMTPDQIAKAESLARNWSPQTSALPAPPATVPTAEPSRQDPGVAAPQASPRSSEQANPAERLNTAPSGQHSDASGSALLFFAVVILIIIIVWRSRNKLTAKPPKLGRDSGGYEQAQTGVPHCGFRWLKEGGFEVALKHKKSPKTAHIFPTGPENHIKVTADAIIINDKRLRPDQFLAFTTGQITYGRGLPEHIVGYTYGEQTIWIPGIWSEQQAGEIVLALNLRLREFWNTLASSRRVDPDPEDLRRSRPTDF